MKNDASFSSSCDAFARAVLLAAGTFERADLSPAPDVTKRYYTPRRERVGTRVKSEVNARKFCSAGPEHVRQHHRIRRRARSWRGRA